MFQTISFSSRSSKICQDTRRCVLQGGGIPLDSPLLGKFSTRRKSLSARYRMHFNVRPPLLNLPDPEVWNSASGCGAFAANDELYTDVSVQHMLHPGDRLPFRSLSTTSRLFTCTLFVVRAVPLEGLWDCYESATYLMMT
jgi:hypothetical protein